MPVTNKVSEIAEYLVDLISQNKTALGVDEVYYGDQQKLNAGVVVCIEPDEKITTLKGHPRVMRVEFSLQIFVYHAMLQSAIASRRANDKCAEAIETLIHEHYILGGLVIDSVVASIQSGIVTKSNSIVRASRMEFRATSQVILSNEEG